MTQSEFERALMNGSLRRSIEAEMPPEWREKYGPQAWETALALFGYSTPGNIAPPPPTVQKFSEDEPRDEAGRWTSGGGEFTDPGEKPNPHMPDDIDKWPNEKAMAWFDEKRAAQNEWDRTMARGVAIGKVPPEEAFARGWNPSVMGGRDSIGQMPDTMYHATVALDAVLDHGLKTQDELTAGGVESTGLGGGSTDTISLTTDKAFADRIAETVIESHDVAVGKITPEDLLGRAQAGGFDGRMREFYDGVHGEGAYQMHILDGQENARGSMVPHMAATLDEMTAEHGPGWQPSPEGRSWPGGDGVMRYTEFVRSSTPDEAMQNRFDLYRSFLAAQSEAGGPTDPVFWAPDPHYYASIDPAQVGVVEVNPVPNAVGYYVGPAEAEWRTWSGDAVTVKALKASRPELRKAAGLQKAEWDPDAHPRDEHGEFTSGGGGIDESKQYGSGFYSRDGGATPASKLALARSETAWERSGRSEADKQAMSKIYKDYLDKSSLRVRIPGGSDRRSVLASVLHNGVQNQFQSGRSEGILDSRFRSQVEGDRWFGKQDVAAGERPVYGYFSHAGDPEHEASAYGDIVLRLNDDVKDRSTFTPSDSLDAEAKSMPVSVQNAGTEGWRAVDPEETQWRSEVQRAYDNPDRLGAASGYVEAQIFGGVRAEDINHIVFTGSPPSDNEERLMRQLNIPWQWTGKLNEYGYYEGGNEYSRYEGVMPGIRPSSRKLEEI